MVHADFAFRTVLRSSPFSFVNSNRTAALVAMSRTDAVGAQSTEEAGELMPADPSGVTKVVEAFADTWNRHDMEAFAHLFAVDAEFVNELCVYREQVRERLHVMPIPCIGECLHDFGYPGRICRHKLPSLFC